MIFSRLFTRRISKKKLAKIVYKKDLKEWKNRLNLAVNYAKACAKDGKSSILLQDNILACAYNNNRPFDDILKDVHKRFVNCKIVRENMHIRISWNILEKE